MFRFLKSMPLFIACFFLFTSCDKETSTENGDFNQNNVAQQGTTSGTALFVIAGAPDNCLTPVISGTYRAGTALNPSNTVELLVNVTALGTYTVSTATTNGIIFSATGTFTAVGLQSIILQGQGIPIATGSYQYMAGSNGCIFTIVAQSSGVITTDCKACSYVPMCDGSTYTYIDTTSTGVNPPVTSSLVFLVDTIIDGQVYQKFNNSSSGPFYYNCTAGISTVISFNGTSVGGVSVARMEQTLLKANAAVGASWQNTITLSAGVAAQYNWSIVAKGISHTVLGNTYPDVIQVHLDVNSLVTGVGTVPAASGEYYYARNVGLIDSEVYNVTSTPATLQNHRVLQSYSIP